MDFSGMVGYRVRSCTLVGESNLLTFGLFRGFTDFAGSAVVHLAGAVLSLPGCVILGAGFVMKKSVHCRVPTDLLDV